MSPERDPLQVPHAIAQADLMRHVAAVRRDLGRACSFRTMMHHHPLLMSGTAFAAGFLAMRLISTPRNHIAAPPKPAASGLLGRLLRQATAIAYRHVLSRSCGG